MKLIKEILMNIEKALGLVSFSVNTRVICHKFWRSEISLEPRRETVWGWHL